MTWIYKFDDPIWQTVVACLIIFIGIIMLTRIVGLRSFAKFTAYDFAFTIAIGSIISSTLTSSTSLAHGFTAITCLLSLTYLFSHLQRTVPKLKVIIANKPLLLMDGKEILTDNLKHSRIEKSQLMAKLREANVLNFDQVQAVVLESTGDISVLHKSSASSSEKFDFDMLEGVRDQP